MGTHIPENTVLWRDPLQPSPGTVPVPAGSPVIRDGRRVRLERTEHAWVFTIPSSRAALGVPDHSLTVALDGSWALCSCGSCVNRDRCTLVDNPRAILRHHVLLPPADPGGATPNRPQGGLDGEQADWNVARDIGRAARLDGERNITVPGDALDLEIARHADTWIASRTHAGVRLTCVACHDVRGWATEAAAAGWLVRDGRCHCGGPGPIPPAPGAARKPLQDHLDLLYGD